MIWLLPLVPLAAGPVLWWAGRGRSRSFLAGGGAGVLVATTALAGWAAAARPTGGYRWGAGLTLRLAVDDATAVMAALVPAVATLVVVYAAVHEPRRGLARLVGTLVAFVGAMELLVLAADVLTLLAGWELVGACSWALIAHQWWKPGTAGAAAEAFVATHVGDLGLFAAAGAAAAGTASLAYGDLGSLQGGWLHLFVAGVVTAAVAKSAQMPFSPWLFSAMAGPTPVSALLHAATMVAAGAFVLVRLHPVLDRVPWFAPVVIGIGLATAIGGGIVAFLQQHAKKVLAASTSAQYGLMFVAVGAGVPAAALGHLVTHAAFKVALFLAVGVAIEAAATSGLGRLRLGRELPVTAAWSAAAAAALAGIPPFGAAWTKEAVTAAAGHHAAWLAVAVATAGGLSAAYATRFQLLAFGPSPSDAPRTLAHRPGRSEQACVAAAALASLAFGVLWIPAATPVVERLLGGTLPAGRTWEVALSLSLVGLAVYATIAAWRAGRLLGDVLDRRRAAAADWLAIPAAAGRAVVAPSLRLAGALGRFDTAVLDAPARVAARIGRAGAAGLAGIDDRVVDGGIRLTVGLAAAAARLGSTVTEGAFARAVAGLGGLVGQAGRDARRLHTGRAHQFYVLIATGAVVLAGFAVMGR